jgi:hypothetical protein
MGDPRNNGSVRDVYEAPGIRDLGETRQITLERTEETNRLIVEEAVAQATGA